MTKKIIFTFGVILTVLVVSACGNKGDLYLPDSDNTETTQ